MKIVMPRGRQAYTHVKILQVNLEPVRGGVLSQISILNKSFNGRVNPKGRHVEVDTSDLTSDIDNHLFKGLSDSQPINRGRHFHIRYRISP